MVIKKNCIALKPALAEWIEDQFHVGTASCRISGNGIWYEGDAGDEYECHIILCLTDAEISEGENVRVLAIPKRGYNPKVGFIYTDPGFLRGVKAHLKALGMPAWTKVDYSEQGMQGDNYVDMEVYSKRAFNWLRKQKEQLG